MAMFGRKKDIKSQRTSTSNVQIPDVLAAEAANLYGHQQFEDALAKYGEAIDKLHTMYVTATNRIREPSPDDDRILEGFVSALDATLAVDENAWVGNVVEVSVNYLRQIGDLCDRENLEIIRYHSAVTKIEWQSHQK